MIGVYSMKQLEKILLVLILGQGLLFGDDTVYTEGGLIHSKQKGRYALVHKLPEKAESFDTAFDYAKVFGTLRLANVGTYHEAFPKYSLKEQEQHTTAVGGIFGFETASFFGMHLHLGTYVSQKVTPLNSTDKSQQNGELSNAEGNSYAYIGEVSLAYKSEKIQAEIGRIRQETPYTNSDDIRMSPNSFEGASLQIKISPSWKMDTYILTRWAGTDSESVDTFNTFVDGGYGLSGGALTYTIDEENEFSVWYYNIDKESDIVYAEMTGDVRFNPAFHMEWGVQGSHIMERSGSKVDGDVLGAMMIADLGYFYTGLSVNYVFEEDNNTITDGFGGGPYYTSLDEQTIGAVSALTPGDDLFVYRIALGVDFGKMGVTGVNLEVVHGHFLVQNSTVDAKENDLVLTYEVTKRWYFETIYSDVSLDNIEDTTANPQETFSFQRLVTRLDYKF